MSHSIGVLERIEEAELASFAAWRRERASGAGFVRSGRRQCGSGGRIVEV